MIVYAIYQHMTLETIVTLPPVSASRLEAWDRCPAAYRFEHVLRLPAPEAQCRPMFIGLAGHAIQERYVLECLAARSSRQPERLPVIAQELSNAGTIPAASTSIYREALAILTPFVEEWEVPVGEVVAVERRFALSHDGSLSEWTDPETWLRGVTDLIRIRQRVGFIDDWKFGWVAQSEEQMRVAWAPGIYGAFLQRWAPRLERIIVSYRYIRTGAEHQVEISRDHAEDTLGWARSTGAAIAQAMAHGDPEAAFPARPSKMCGSCLWVLRCPAGQAGLQALGDHPIESEGEARQLAGLLLAGEARLDRLRDRLKAYLAEREPLALRDTLQIGFFPTKGVYNPEAVRKALVELGADPGAVLKVDNLALSRLFRRHTGLEERLAGMRQPGHPWFGHKKVPR